MYTNTDMTLYKREYDHTTRLNKLVRHEIKGVMWQDSKGANVNKSGMETADSVTVFVPLANMTVEPKIGDYMVKGITTLEVTRISELEKLEDARVITKVDKKDYGSASMRHYELGGK